MPPVPRVRATYRFTVTRTARTPATYAAAWLTDYRDGDGRFSRPRTRFRTVRLDAGRVLRIRRSLRSARVPRVAVHLVRLGRRGAWHADEIGEGGAISVDYAVRSCGRRACRVTVAILEVWTTPGFPKRVVEVAATHRLWDRLIAALEADYRNGAPARG